MSAIVSSMQDMGLTARDVGIKVNSRKILNGLMTKVGEPPQHSLALPPTVFTEMDDLTYLPTYMHAGIPEDKWVETCILVDKLEKVREPTLLCNRRTTLT